MHAQLAVDCQGIMTPVLLIRGAAQQRSFCPVSAKWWDDRCECTDVHKWVGTEPGSGLGRLCATPCRTLLLKQHAQGMHAIKKFAAWYCFRHSRISFVQFPLERPPWRVWTVFQDNKQIPQVTDTRSNLRNSHSTLQLIIKHKQSIHGATAQLSVKTRTALQKC